MARVFVSDAMDGWTVKATMKDVTVWKSEKVTGGTLYTYTPSFVLMKQVVRLTIKVSGTPEEHWPDFDVIVVGQTSQLLTMTTISPMAMPGNKMQVRR